MSCYFLANGQSNTHMLIGPASYYTTGGGDYYSWSIGEVIVFNESPNPGISIAQSMQSYINPPKVDCFKINASATNKVLCANPTAQVTTLDYSITSSPVTTYDTLEWYFAEDKNKEFYKVVGAIRQKPFFTPSFPGVYKLCAVSITLKCKECSQIVNVDLSSTIGTPNIIKEGEPAKNLKVNYTSAIATTIQWYAFIPSLDKYLLVVGGTQLDLKVRYDGEYMAIISYENGCKMTAATGVSGYNKPLYRATDTKIDGNTIFIPEETAYEHSALKVFPNPAINSFTIRYESSSEIVSKALLYSNTGLAVKEIKFNDGDYWSKTAVVNAEDLSAGVYFLKINEGDRQIVEKVVLQK